MSTTAVGQCPHCAAVINRNWRECLACHTIITHTAEPGKPIDLPDARLSGYSTKRQVRSVCVSAIQPGAFVTWRRGDKTHPEAFVDFLHTDDTGIQWAFVSLPGGTWAAVNVKFLKEVNP